MKDGGTGTLAFIAQLIASLAWPATLLTCVLLLRRHLVALIPLLRTVKYSDVEIRFGREVAELAKTAESSSLPSQPPSAKRDQWEDIGKLAQLRPRTAIRMAFRRVEETIVGAAQSKGVEVADGAMGMPMVVGAILLNKGVISVEQYELLSKLRVLVNEAEQAAPDSIRTESASEFVELALRLAASVGA